MNLRDSFEMELHVESTLCVLNIDSSHGHGRSCHHISHQHAYITIYCYVTAIEISASKN